jgi:hypothetical protein
MADSVLLFTDDSERARREIEALGGRITQQFTERVLVAVLPETVEPESLTASTVEQPESLDLASEMAGVAGQVDPGGGAVGDRRRELGHRQPTSTRSTGGTGPY